jgi:hypothetical protein
MVTICSALCYPLKATGLNPEGYYEQVYFAKSVQRQITKNNYKTTAQQTSPIYANQTDSELQI